MIEGTKTLGAIDPAAKSEIDLPSHGVRVESNEDRETLVSTLGEAGYPPNGRVASPANPIRRPATGGEAAAELIPIKRGTRAIRMLTS